MNAGWTVAILINLGMTGEDTVVGQRFCLTAMSAKRFDRSAVNAIPATLNAMAAERYERTAANGLRANLTAITAERYELSAANSNCGDTCG